MIQIQKRDIVSCVALTICPTVSPRSPSSLHHRGADVNRKQDGPPVVPAGEPSIFNNSSKFTQSFLLCWAFKTVTL